MGYQDLHKIMPANTVGVLAGLGPLAGAHFYRQLIERTSAFDDSEHLPIVLVSDNTIPSRVDHLLDKGPSPLPRFIELVHLLEAAGVSIIVIPSSTSHAYHRELQNAARVPILNLLSEVPRKIDRLGLRRPGLLATTPTVKLDLYRPYFRPEIELVYPDEETQEEVQKLVFDVKGNNDLTKLSAKLAELASRPWASRVDCMVLACTELCLFGLDEANIPVITANEVLIDAIFRAL